MTTFTVEVKDEGVQSLLQTLQKRMGNLQPAFSALGGDMESRVKQRFDAQSAPDGTPWERLSDTTMALYVRGFSQGHFKKSGDLNKRGASKLASKKKLIGKTGDLSRQIGFTATPESLTLYSTPVYAAMQHFGGITASNSMIPGRRIPARPFMPVKADGSLYPEEQRLLITALEEFLTADF